MILEAPQHKGSPGSDPKGAPSTESTRTSSPKTTPSPGLFKATVDSIQAFLHLEAAGGIVLLACAALALLWANLSFESYRDVFELNLGLRLGRFAIDFTLHELVNDGLMTLFFFVVGMGIKWELTLGELKTVSQAMLPALAALGGMVVPAIIFLAFNAGRPGARGFGIPMETDVAFAVGVLTLLRSRVPRALLVFVTALAIFDDIGGILVIALFYGEGIELAWVAVAAVIALSALALTRARVQSSMVWAFLLLLLWYAFHRAELSPTLAGVVVGLFVPARPRVEPRQVLEEASIQAALLARLAHPVGGDDSAMAALEKRIEALESPLSRLVRALHPWVAFLVVPLFALANSGVHLSGLGFKELTGRVTLGIAVALLLGKPAGIVAFTLAAAATPAAKLPSGTSVPKLLGAAVVAGIGFTVSLFIAGLAYPTAAPLLDEAKVGILAGSLLSGVLGGLLLLQTKRLPSESS